MTEIPDAPEGWTFADPAAVERARTDGGLRVAAAAALWRPGRQAGAEAQIGGYLYEVVDKVVSAILPLIAGHGLVVVAWEDLAETVEDAHAFNNTMLGGDDAATARLDRLRAVLSGTLHAPHGPEIDSALPGIQGPADTRTSPPSVRTSPHVRTPGPTSNPRNEEA